MQSEKAAAFIFEVDSNEELDSLLQNLPYWGLVKMKATPLQDIEGRRERDRQQADQINAPATPNIRHIGVAPSFATLHTCSLLSNEPGKGLRSTAPPFGWRSAQVVLRTS